MNKEITKVRQAFIKLSIMTYLGHDVYNDIIKDNVKDFKLSQIRLSKPIMDKQYFKN